MRLGFVLLTAIFHLVLLQQTLDFLAAHTPLAIRSFLMPADVPSFPTALLITTAEVLLLAIYLWWPPFQRRLGRWFLPVGLVLATVNPIMTQHYSVAWLDSSHVFVLGGAWQLVVVLFLPLVLIAGQYGFHTVLKFAAGTAVLDAGLTILAVRGGNMAGLHSLLGIILVRTILYIVVGYLITRLMAYQRTQRRELAQANAQLAQHAATLEQLSISRERNRLARELHDTLAHTLSGASVQLEAVDALWETDPGAARTMLTQALVTTRTGLVETRRALQALRASPLDDLGLALALRNLAGSLASRAGLAVELDLPEHLDDLNPMMEQAVYRVAQEAVANIDRHANAGHVTIQLQRENQHLALTIVDDGWGFAGDEVNTDSRFGIKGMKERAEMIGGTVEIDSRPGAGTTVRLTVPVGDSRGQVKAEV